MVGTPVPKAVPGAHNSIAAQYARAKAIKDAADEKAAGVIREKQSLNKMGKPKSTMERLNERKAGRFKKEWAWVIGFFTWLLFIHISGLYFFTKGFLLTRLVLDDKSSCAKPPIAISKPYTGVGTPEVGCWHPKTFDKAVVVLIDALRYDFTIPFNGTGEGSSGGYQAFHNAFPFLYETAVAEPQNAFLLPFIADPPTTTLQRLKGLTTGTLPTFIDMGSNFAGTAIEEDNLLDQMRSAGKRIVHLGDDTWTALFPDYFVEDLSRAYDSLNVFDLHTLDNGVNEHIFPLLEPAKRKEWDVMFAHYLGVDHAGHRYRPNHPAMTAKLQQMDGIIRDIVKALDDDTLLVVMGDHGMDVEGNHGGESDDEVQAALWMYSRKGIFGRTDPAYLMPPETAKIRPVNQIDLVPTLALLLGLPIPFNNLGRPIEEAFAGKRGNAWENLAAVGRMAAAGTKKYQAAYFKARGIDESTIEGSPHDLWVKAENVTAGSIKGTWRDSYDNFSAFSSETLRICRDLWARFDVSSMAQGIGMLAAGLLALILYTNSNADEDSITDGPEITQAEIELELKAFEDGSSGVDEEETTSRILLRGALIGTGLGALGAPAIWVAVKGESYLNFMVGLTSISSLAGVLYQEVRRRMEFDNPFPTTFWGWTAVTFTLAQSIGFASNSYTIWEDSILLFFISSFGLLTAASSLRLDRGKDRTLGIYHSFAFVILGWIASFSKLCREEQMPYCKSNFYDSATSLTLAPWQLIIPFMIAVFLPSIIKSYYTTSRSYEGFAPAWISWAFRGGLMLSAIFWILDAADDGDWFPSLRPGLLKDLRVPIAQTVFAVVAGVGTTSFGYAPPCVNISTGAPSGTEDQVTTGRGPTITILGFANAHGTRYFLLVTNILLCVLMVQKPVGAGAIALMAWQILSLVEILDLNSLTSSSIGPVMLALLGSFHFFKTGHQATLSSVQWETAFIALHSLRYPWSPLLVALNSFGAQILAATSVPLVVLWKQEPRKKGILKSVITALGWHVAYYATIGLATTIWAGHLRRHLMLYRIFCPKFMTAAVVLLVVDLISIFVALFGVRWNTLSVGEVFGWG